MTQELTAIERELQGRLAVITVVRRYMERLKIVVGYDYDIHPTYKKLVKLEGYLVELYEVAQIYGEHAEDKKGLTMEANRLLPAVFLEADEICMAHLDKLIGVV